MSIPYLPSVWSCMSGLDAVGNRLLFLCSRSEEPPLVCSPGPVLWRLHGASAPWSRLLNQCQIPAIPCCLQPPHAPIGPRPSVKSHVPAVACGQHPLSISSSPRQGAEDQYVLLPPSSFMTSKSQTKVCSCAVQGECEWIWTA